jgi:hypothetical protein
MCWFQWPLGLSRGSAAARLLGLRVWIPSGNGCLSLVSVVRCQVEVSTTGPLLVQSIPTEYGVSECDRESATMRGPTPTAGCWVTEVTSCSHAPFHYQAFILHWKIISLCLFIQSVNINPSNHIIHIWETTINYPQMVHGWVVPAR